jgi:SsrA-binding protein
MKIVNKKAYYDYFVVEEYICGLVLQGSEVKSLRRGDVNFNDGYIIFKDGELFIKNMRIAQYKEATYNNHEEMRDKKILLTKKEISKISKSYDEKGITVIPLEVFILKNRFKIKLGVCRGKKNWNKKESIKAKDIEREIRRDNGYNT